MLFTEDQDKIQALAAKRPDQAFNIWILPGRARCDRAVANPHPSHPAGSAGAAVHRQQKRRVDLHVVDTAADQLVEGFGA